MEVAVPAKRRLPIDLAAVAQAMDDGDRSQREHLLDTHTGALVTLVPLIIAFLVLRRYWRAGLLLGSLAGG